MTTIFTTKENFEKTLKAMTQSTGESSEDILAKGLLLVDLYTQLQNEGGRLLADHGDGQLKEIVLTKERQTEE